MKFNSMSVRLDLTEGLAWQDEIHAVCDPLVVALRAVQKHHKDHTIPVNSPMGTYFTYCEGCSTIKKGQNPCVDQRGLVGFPCPEMKDVYTALGISHEN